MTPWTDGFGRKVRALRVSVTDRCELRCVYCMPETPVWLPKAEVLSYEELARLTAVAVSCGVEKVRVTGGEPLARRDLPRFVQMLRKLPLRELTMTTNGLSLARHAKALRGAGLDRVTVSLDTLRSERFAEIARRPGLEKVLEGMAAAEDAGFRPIKVNAVVIRGFNEDEVEELAAWGRETGRLVRFIEFMPLEGDRIWNKSRLVPASEILDRIAARFPLKRREDSNPHDTALTYDYLDGRGSVGVIASVTRAFCASCDRVRITADGGFRTCLFAREASDLRGPLRAGASDAELAALMAGAVRGKWAGHLINLPGFERPDRPMYAIGG
ncbi:MAG TPA: GTP 3',8-cyclase MoaA [Elusimicrobiota bacterium]|nr:GTP 3',8-cyclase MoaA [Elusimicrobiota bacterium]